MEYDEFGRELPDRTPVEVPLDFRRPLTLQEEIMRFVRREMSLAAEKGGYETFEESDDFDVDDEGLPFSPHELTPAQEERIMARDASNLEKPGNGNGSRSDEGRTGADNMGAEVRGSGSSEAGGTSAAPGREVGSAEARSGARGAGG